MNPPLTFPSLKMARPLGRKAIAPRPAVQKLQPPAVEIGPVGVAASALQGKGSAFPFHASAARQ
jgi:hypothetical protein